MKQRDCLIEIGTDELAPDSLFALAQDFAKAIEHGLYRAGVQHGPVEWFATPRRFAVRISGLADYPSAQEPDSERIVEGPAVAHGLREGVPTQELLTFAAQCGVAVNELKQRDGSDGRVFVHVDTRTPQPTTQLLPGIVSTALGSSSPVARAGGRNGAHDPLYPLLWVVMLQGTRVVDATIYGTRSDRFSRGHRSHTAKPLAIPNPTKYAQLLRDKGRVLVNVEERRRTIQEQISTLASEVGGQAIVDAIALDRAVAQVEWPVCILGHFDSAFLQLPAEVVVAVLQSQRGCISVRGGGEELLSCFIAVTNVQSRAPQRVRQGYERVVAAQLADAVFLWEQDCAQPLASRHAALHSMSIDATSGSWAAKTIRISTLAAHIAELTGSDVGLARRAGELAKCDLSTRLVRQFPQLRGVVGRHSAHACAEHAEVCSAIEEHYWPGVADDRLPTSGTGVAVALADKLDTLASVFVTSRQSSVSHEALGLSQAAMGVLCICIERSLTLDLREVIDRAVSLQPVQGTERVGQQIWMDLLDRLRGTFIGSSNDFALAAELFDAVLAARPQSPIDVFARLEALQEFLKAPQAQGLIVASQRIADMLGGTNAGEISDAVQSNLLLESPEQQLFAHVLAMERAITPICARRDYHAALAMLSGLTADIDAHLDSLAQAATEEVRLNRLALVARARPPAGAVHRGLGGHY